MKIKSENWRWPKKAQKPKPNSHEPNLDPKIQ